MIKKWLLKIACSKDLRGEDYRVLLVMLSAADSESIVISQTEIAKTLKIERSQVSRAIVRLILAGAIEKEIISNKAIYHFLLDFNQDPNQTIE